jgi:SAM-dependent methyltransferase
MPYPRTLVDALRDALSLDGTGRLLDVGCGPGSLTHLLAPLFAGAVGVDADAGMVELASRRAAGHEQFVRLRAEELPAGLGTFRVVTLAQSFHWFETVEVARTLGSMLEPGGRLVHVGATTHEGDGNVPRGEIAELIERWVGPDPRVRRFGAHREILPCAGFHCVQEIEVARDETLARSDDEVVASVFSLSYASPHLFGARVGEFERELRALLHGRGPFHERPRPVTVSIWSPG